MGIRLINHTPQVHVIEHFPLQKAKKKKLSKESIIKEEITTGGIFIRHRVVVKRRYRIIDKRNKRIEGCFSS
jgi:hypothetical protein